MIKKCIGVDIGGTTIKSGIFDVEGNLLKSWQIPTRKEDDGKYIIDDIAESIQTKLAVLGIPLEDVIGVGMGVPGPVLPDGFVEVCVNVGWKNIYAERELSKRLGGIPTKSNNDANVAALGEMWQGGGKGYSDLVMITLGTGVGCGIVIDQKIIGGRHGLAGEIGHIHVRNEEKEYCNCGGRGCLEQVASATGIVREAGRILKATDLPSKLRGKEEFSAKDVLDLAKLGDEACIRTMGIVGDYLGLTLFNMTLTIDPEVFVIGGGVSKAGSYLLDLIEKYYTGYCVISKNRPKLCLAKLGNDAGIYGAARLICG